MKLSLGFLSQFQKVIAGAVFALIIVFFIVSRRQEDKWDKLKKGLAESYGESPVSATDSPVYAIDVEGSARYKRPSWLNWWPLKMGVELQPGDLVYVDDESKVVLFFITQDSIVTLPESTLFHVGLTVPQMSKLRTSGGVSSDIGAQPESRMESPNAEMRFSTRVIQNPSLKKAGEGDSDAGKNTEVVVLEDDLKIVRNTRNLKIAYPGPNVELHARRFPTSLPVTFQVTDKRIKLWGYLWQGRELEPQWSSVASSGFPRVPIEKPGMYVFQALSEDELYASPAIMIRAVKRGSEDFLPKPEKWLEGVRVFQ
jgi:hypothetical protein